jgi:hypothetical protein
MTAMETAMLRSAAAITDKTAIAPEATIIITVALA